MQLYDKEKQRREVKKKLVTPLLHRGSLNNNMCLVLVKTENVERTHFSFS